MATDKHSNSSPAVSQLAGEIARSISRHMRIKIHDLWEPTGPNSPSDPSNKAWLDQMEEQDAPGIEKLISAALSEREEKIRELIETAQIISSNHVGWLPGAYEANQNLKAALSALGE